MQSKKLFGLCIILATLVLFPNTATAQTETPTSPPTSVPTVIPTAGPTTTTGRNFGQKVRELRADFREAMKEKKEEVKILRERQKAAFQARLASFKDERRKTILLRLDDKFSSINSSRTDRMTDAIEKMQQIVTALTEKAAQAKQDGVDTTAVDAAILAAETALTNASTAVQVQAAKTYDMQVTDATVKPVAGETISQLQQDLRTTHAKVKEAKEAVRKVAEELRKVLKSARLSGTPAPVVSVTAAPTALPATSTPVPTATP